MIPDHDSVDFSPLPEGVARRGADGGLTMIREGRVLSDSVLSAFCLPFPRAENREAVGKANVGLAVASDELALAAELDRLRAFGVAVVLPSGRVRELEGDGRTRDEEGVGVSRRVWTERRCLYRAFR